MRFLALLTLLLCGSPALARPNILWISSEDHGPHVGCYGDAYATTPNIDKLAAKGMLYVRCWSNAPVCAPARTTVISGMYPTSTGAEHMRSMVALPAQYRLFPHYLRMLGYFCTNNVKEDYNVSKGAPKKDGVWDQSSPQAHWRNRGKDQPFFAVFNSTKSHESQIRTRPHKQVHDPAKVRVPAYHPDTPEVRQDWAQYYDQVSAADADAGRVLAQLLEDGLADDTIIFYWADHGSGMPRNKRWPFNIGLHVPLVVWFPPKYRDLAPADYHAGGRSNRLVSFVDFAPTMLSLAGVEAPKHFQGQAFLGKYAAEPRTHLHGFRGRMDERLDLVRSVTDGRYSYIRNYMPHLIYGQHLEYMWQTPTTRVWKKLFTEGKLDDAQAAFWKSKPPEELYDLANDRDEVKNLANSPDHRDVLEKLRKVQQDHARKIRDVGFIPEGDRFTRAKDSTIFEMGQDDRRYPFEKVFAMAEWASMLDAKATPKLLEGLKDSDSAVRYWAALGLQMRGRAAVMSARPQLLEALKDGSPFVRMTAAEALGHFGEDEDLKTGLSVLMDHADWGKHDLFVAMAALQSLDALGPKAAGLAGDIAKLPTTGPSPNERYSGYVGRLLLDLRRPNR